MPVSRRRKKKFTGRPVVYRGRQQHHNPIANLTASGERYLNQAIEFVERSLDEGRFDEMSQFVIDTLSRIEQRSAELNERLGRLWSGDEDDDEEDDDDE